MTMLRSLQLENFKAFGQRTVIPLAPITLILGQNSAGKSSVLQALSLLKQSRANRDTGALLLPRTEGGYADLGSFQEMVFDHDLSRTVAVRLEMPWSPPKRRKGKEVVLPDFPSVGYELGFSRRSQEQDITLGHLKVFLGQMEKPVAVFSFVEVTPDIEQWALEDCVRSSRRMPAVLRAVQCVEITDDPAFYEPAHQHFCKLRRYVYRGLRRAWTNFDAVAQERTLFDDDEEWQQDRDKIIRNAHQRLRDRIKEFSKKVSLSEYIEAQRKEWLTTKLLLDGFIPLSSWSTIGLESLWQLDFRFGLDSRFGVRLPKSREPSLSAIALRAGTTLEGLLRKVFPLGPFRRAPQRWYVFSGTTPENVGFLGNSLPDLLYRKPELVDSTNSWLQRLDIGYRLQVQPLGGRDKDLFEVRLQDTRRQPAVDVALSDVGYGISQILPFIVQGLTAKEEIITIEQPEVHIHPRLQADLGDLLIEAIQEQRRNQFIIETHSEHLALRLQRRVREKKLSPNDISVVYVSRGANGATVQPLRLDEEGDFMDDFPGGFFPERLRELR